MGSGNIIINIKHRNVSFIIIEVWACVCVCKVAGVGMGVGLS